MTDCPNGDVRDLLPDLLHDRLAPAVRREVESHVRDCADCQAELALLRVMRSSLGRAPAVDVAAIAAAIPPHRAPARRAWGGWRAAAAAVVLLAAGGTSVAVVQRGANPDRDTAAAAVVVGSRATAPASANVATTNSVVPAASTAQAPRELAVASPAIGDLDDAELSALLKDIATVDVLPPVDVEPAAVLSPVSPRGTE